MQQYARCSVMNSSMRPTTSTAATATKMVQRDGNGPFFFSIVNLGREPVGLGSQSNTNFKVILTLHTPLFLLPVAFEGHNNL